MLAGGMALTYDLRWGQKTRPGAGIRAAGKMLRVANDVRRMPDDQIIWLGAATDSPVYWNDRVFSGKASAAVVHLDSGTELTLGSSSLIQIAETPQGIRVNLLSGKVRARTLPREKASVPHVVIESGARVEVEGDAEIERASSGEITVQSFTGRARITPPTLPDQRQLVAPQEVTAEAGSALRVETPTRITPAPVQSPTLDETYVRQMESSKTGAAITFPTTSFDPVDVPASLPPPDPLPASVPDPVAPEIPESVDIEARAPGMDFSVARWLAQLWMVSAVAEEKTSGIAVPLRWGAVTGASGYRIQLAQDPEFRHLILDRKVSANQTSVQVDQPGIWYWRLGSISADGKRESPWSRPSRINVRRKQPIIETHTTNPEGNTVLRWQAGRLAGRWKILVDGRIVETVKTDGNLQTESTTLPQAAISGQHEIQIVALDTTQGTSGHPATESEKYLLSAPASGISNATPEPEEHWGFAVSTGPTSVTFEETGTDDGQRIAAALGGQVFFPFRFWGFKPSISLQLDSVSLLNRSAQAAAPTLDFQLRVHPPLARLSDRFYFLLSPAYFFRNMFNGSYGYSRWMGWLLRQGLRYRWSERNHLQLTVGLGPGNGESGLPTLHTSRFDFTLAYEHGWSDVGSYVLALSYERMQLNFGSVLYMTQQVFLANFELRWGELVW